ncbi:hypothetical protein ACFXGA_36245 [Actinosynnema sp. NPDC059335]|uniref:hypothetical protein n=1 Tax=Actinosynnema sp. NPDC059335 TaxID=3346804 RepID=UPI00366E6CE0
MARWVWPAVAGVVTSATGVAISLAADAAGNPWAWVAVALLVVLGVVVTLRVQPTTPPAGPEPRPATTVHNSVSGSVTGSVVQAGDLGSVTINSPTTVNQHAVAREGGTVHQAGRDIRRD